MATSSFSNNKRAAIEMTALYKIILFVDYYN